MAFSPGEHLLEGSLAAQKESSLLFSGHLIATISAQDPQKMIPLTLPLLSLSAQRAIKTEMPSCLKSFVIPIAWTIKALTSQDQQLALQTLSKIGGQDLGRFMAKWIDYTPKLTSEAS